MDKRTTGKSSISLMLALATMSTRNRSVWDYIYPSDNPRERFSSVVRKRNNKSKFRRKKR